MKFDNFVIDLPVPGKKGISYSAIFKILDNEVFPEAATNHNLFVWATEDSLRMVETLLLNRNYKLHTRFIWNKGNCHEYFVWYYKESLPPMNTLARKRMKSVFASAGSRSCGKPDIAYDMVKGLYPNSLSIEVFGQEDRLEWLQWKNTRREDLVKKKGD